MKFLKNHKGFTLIEMISVILVLGVISAVAIPAFDRGGVSATLSANTVQTDIQYIQELAMTRNKTISITFNASTDNYVITLDPGGVYPAETRDLPQGTTIQTGGTVTFNKYGERASGSDTSIVLESGGSTATVTIDQFTGRATVS